MPKKDTKLPKKTTKKATQKPAPKKSTAKEMKETVPQKDLHGNMESTSEMHHHDVPQKGGHMAVGAQYVKDLSFESPRAPHSLVVKSETPKIDLRVDATAHKIQGDTYEVDIHIVTKALVEKSVVVFLCDLTYSGLFSFQGVPEKEREVALLVQGANSLFPFARRIVADLTRDGGFPTLMLDPVDFGQVYKAKLQQASAKKKKA